MLSDEELREKISKKALDSVARLMGCRVFSFQVTKLLLKTKITPNQVTYFEILLTILAAALICTARHQYIAIGVILVQLSIYLDYVDGDLARAKSMDSPFGDWLDTLAGQIRTISILLSIIYVVFIQTGNTIALILGALTIFNMFVYMTLLERLKGKANFVAREETWSDEKRLRRKVKDKIAKIAKIKVSLNYFDSFYMVRLIIMIGGLFNKLYWVLIYYLVWSAYSLISLYFEAHWTFEKVMKKNGKL